MYKKIALSGVLCLAIAFPYNSVHANTYMTAASNAVDHIMGFHNDSDNTEINVVVEPEKKPASTQRGEPATPVKETKTEVKKTIWVTATAYSSTPWQTDSTPCITSTGYDVCNKTANIIAVSRDLVRSLGYHRQVMLPSLYGSEIFLIEDTMNARFVNRIDVHHGSTQDAREFGLKRNVELQVI